jgi:hypothetical protein
MTGILCEKSFYIGASIDARSAKWYPIRPLFGPRLKPLLKPLEKCILGLCRILEPPLSYCLPTPHSFFRHWVQKITASFNQKISAEPTL